MTKEDLMSGNLVKLHFITGNYCVIRVAEVTEIGITFYSRGRQLAKWSAVYPIQATPKIFEKSGWEKKEIDGMHTEYVSSDSRCVIDDDFSDDGSWRVCADNGNSYTFNYIHELQIFLHLCKMDELAKSIKV